MFNCKLRKLSLKVEMWTGSEQKHRRGFEREQQLNLNRVGLSWPYIIFLTSF